MTTGNVEESTLTMELAVREKVPLKPGSPQTLSQIMNLRYRLKQGCSYPLMEHLI